MRSVTRQVVLVGVLLVAPSTALAETAPDARSVSLEVGAYRMVDRADSAYDGPEVDLRGRVGVVGPWSFVSELGTSGEFAGGRGTCLGEASARSGASLVIAPGPAWLRLHAAAGGGLVFARLYGSLLGMASGASPALVAYGDRWLPQAWLSLRLDARVAGSVTFFVDAFARAMPRATFHADHLPGGTSSDFYPVYRHDHDLSTYGGALGLAARF